jgi:hypothetical protein
MKRLSTVPGGLKQTANRHAITAENNNIRAFSAAFRKGTAGVSPARLEVPAFLDFASCCRYNGVNENARALDFDIAVSRCTMGRARRSYV